MDAQAHAGEAARDVGVPRCAAVRRRRADVEFGELRVRLREAEENRRLIEDHATGPVRSAGDAFDEAAAALDEVAVADLDTDALMGTVLSVEAQRRKLDALNVRLLGALDARGGTEAKVGLRTKRWKANRTHGSVASVGRELKVARTLARFDAFDEALTAGDVSVDHLLVLAGACKADRITDALVGLQHSLVMFAKAHRFEVFARHVRHLAALLDEDGPEPDCGDRDTAAMGSDLEGHLHLRLEVSGYNAIEAKQIIGDETDRQYRAAVREHEATGVPIPPVGVLRARAVMEILRRGTSANPQSRGPVTSAAVCIGVDAAGHPAGVHDSNGDDVDPVTAAVLVCDAVLQPVGVDSAGVPIVLGRTTRLFTGAQRDAMGVRDGGCVFPGCDQPPSRCDAHHRRRWVDGGRTDIDNGAMLCRRHHGLVHSNEPWRIRDVGIDDLPADLAETHRVRAATARLEPARVVTVIETPHGETFLAQNATDHHGPAPPRRTAA